MLTVSFYSWPRLWLWVNWVKMASKRLYVCCVAGPPHNTYNHFKALCPGLPGWARARRNLLLDFMIYGVTGDIRGRRTDNLARHHSIRTNQWHTSLILPFLRHMPFLSQPSQFILAWDRHQKCWLAYPVAWLRLYVPLDAKQVISETFSANRLA